MDFSSPIFWLTSLPLLILIYIGNHTIFLQSRQFNKYALCALSLILLSMASSQTLIIFLAVTSLAYVGCRIGQNWNTRKKTILLSLIIPFQLLPLLYYKYAHFILNDIFQRDWNTFQDMVIPIGISFYTFQTIAFCIDTLKRGQKVPKFIDYMNFCCFFPQIVAGPIERKDSLLPQMENLRLIWKQDVAAQGIPYICLGLFFKMVMADNLASGMLVHYEGTNALQIWANNLSFGFRIYFDFAGYGLTAYGIAKVLNINITLNFQSPYTCSNISNFWRNWHISLTQWFRDYIYFALGGSRTKFWWFNIIFMFFVSGIWHGAGWNFIIWGLLSGIAMVIHRYFSKLNISLHPFVGWILTYITMTFIWMFFYESDMKIITKNLLSILKIANYDINSYIQLAQNTAGNSAIFLIFLPISFCIIALEYVSKIRHQDSYKIFLSPSACMIMVTCIFILHPAEPAQFIYFAF